MTEFDYDVWQRKQLARQAKYRKRGSKNKKCTLRQDHMTNAQLRKMNGEVIQFHMNQPIRSWTEFRSLSPASAREYIGALSSEYAASTGDLARMFGCSYNTVKKYLQEIGASASPGRMPADNVPSWNRFLGGEEEEPEIVTATSDKVITNCNQTAEEEPAPQIKSHPIPAMAMREFSLEFAGVIDLQGIVNSLRYALGESARGTIRVSFRAENDDPIDP